MAGMNTFNQSIFTDNPAGKMNASASLPRPLTIENIISRGDILRKNLPSTYNPWVVLYQGNGRFSN
jgi:hypothetical protein